MTKKIIEKKVALVTGSAGFIGFHLCNALLESGYKVIGLDCLSDYYSVDLKRKRESILLEDSDYKSFHGNIEDKSFIGDIFSAERPQLVFHLAAQAGVRKSLETPDLYLNSNVFGTFRLLEAAKIVPPKHVLIASTSSVYGANNVMPYREIDTTDHQLSFYAATKKSIENISHSYSHLFKLPITIFRFFTVYGPWGRPDMAYYKFASSILKDEVIDIYNHGKMERDFTYIDDLVKSVMLLKDVIPSEVTKKENEMDSLSPVAPYRVVNIGNSRPSKLEELIYCLEKELDRTAQKNYVEMQKGDVISTWASSELLNYLTGFSPSTELEEGLNSFVSWFREYHSMLFKNQIKKL